MKCFLVFLGCSLLTLAATAQLNCRSFEYRQLQISHNPALDISLQQIESFTRKQLQGPSVMITGGPSAASQTSASLPVITIPVVFHIVYNSSSQNISDAQIHSQLDVLNRDYRKLNADTAGIPGYFSPLAADCGFQFALAGVDTNGNATTGIVRRHTVVQAFSINDDIKFTASGGDDAWDRDRYLNIWVGNLTGGILGYSSVVGDTKETDGITVLYTAFGTTGTATAPFNLGRTATHEIGHWLNMIHVWGDAYCGDDEVADTPPQQTSTQGNPSGMIVSCGNGPYGNMYMDYMDFTDDIGMHMFTYGQRARMRTLFDPGGFRYAILSSDALSEAALPTTDTTEAGPAGADIQILQVYPNPATDMVLVKLNDGSKTGCLLDVFNQVGQKLMTTRITSSSFLLNISSLPRGIYFIRLRNGQQGNSVKLVKI
jgi:hypothetical protein